MKARPVPRATLATKAPATIYNTPARGITVYACTMAARRAEGVKYFVRRGTRALREQPRAQSVLYVRHGCNA